MRKHQSHGSLKTPAFSFDELKTDAPPAHAEPVEASPEMPKSMNLSKGQSALLEFRFNGDKLSGLRFPVFTETGLSGGKSYC